MQNKKRTIILSLFVLVLAILFLACSDVKAGVIDMQQIWSSSGDSQANSYYGASVSSAGDVNGDGYDDVIVGAATFDGGKGKVYVYLGNSSGLSSVPIWESVGETAGDYYGSSVSWANINGDEYDDIIIGAYGYNSNAGKVYVYYGTSFGPFTFSSVLTGSQSGALFGSSVSSAGDVNNDGFDDIVVGAYQFDTGSYTNAGKVDLFLGAASGLNTISAWGSSGEDDQNNAYYGYSVSSAGDVNGDNYDDIIVGAYGEASNKGKAFVYLGNSVGLSDSNNAVWSQEGENNNDLYSNSVSSAGDVNGDGYDDVIVGASQFSVDNTGKVYVYLGESNGLNAATAWVSSGDVVASANFGYRVAFAGDVNGDGYGDVVISATGVDVNKGKIYLYFGSASGLFDSAVWSYEGESAGDFYGFPVLSAGDVNGNGYSDIVVGASGYSSFMGKAYVYSNQAEYSININSDNTITKSRKVGLSISAYNNPSQMIVSENENFSEASWEAFASSKDFKLSLGEGEKIVYARFKDSNDYESKTVSDSIVYAVDTTIGKDEKIILSEDLEGKTLKGQGLIIYFKKLPNKLTKNDKYWMKWKKFNRYPKKWKKKKKVSMRRYWRLTTNLRKYKVKKKKQRYKIRVAFKYTKKLYKKLKKKNKSIKKKDLYLKFRTKKGKKWKPLKKYWKNIKIKHKKKRRRFIVKYFTKFKKKKYYFAIGIR